MGRNLCLALALIWMPALSAAAAPAVGAVREIIVRTPRDIGYFAGDLVKATVDIVVDDGFVLDNASLPHPGPLAYWLDIRSIDATSGRAGGGGRRVTLSIVYQNFYDALDTRPQEIPTFPIHFKNGDTTIEAYVPAWTIGVSALREVAPPVKSDPKDYLRADAGAGFVETDLLWQGAAACVLAAVLCLLMLLYDRGAWPFHVRATRAFGDVERRLRRLSAEADTDARYLEAMVLLHRGIDRTDGRRILADDLAGFVTRHPVFAAKADGLARFFAASRIAFFGSDPSRSRATMPYRAIERLAANLASVERTRP